MAHTLYVSTKDADALKLCVCATLGSANVDASVVSGASVPDRLDVPLPSLGCPILATASGNVIQDVSTAAVFLGESSISVCLSSVDAACVPAPIDSDAH